MKNGWLLRIAVVLCGAACMAPGCNGDVLTDSAFRLWCGPNEDQLCSWQVDTGTVRKAPTWNDHEFGVELVDPGTQISQTSSEGSECMEFSAVADVEAAADVKVAIDFDLDGKEDYKSNIDETHWHVARTLIHAPPGYGQHLRFIVRKEGAGHALLAELRLQRATTCSGPPEALTGMPIGDVCTDDSQCASHVCCGVQHVGDGIGIYGSCSQCCGSCTAGATCKPRSDFPSRFVIAPPSLCDPQQKKGNMGDPCFDDSDCVRTCAGVMKVLDPSCADAGQGTCAVVEYHAGTCG
jgi:hypothetical protein